jgi:predicted P-loop ATPase
MAQWSRHARLFDDEWGSRRAFAVRVLRDIENDWLLSDADFPSREAVAVLLAVFSWHIGVGQFKARAKVADYYVAVEKPEAECGKLAAGRTEMEYCQAVADLCEILEEAAASWLSICPSEPAGEQVIDSMLKYLSSERFVTIRYG